MVISRVHKIRTHAPTFLCLTQAGGSYSQGQRFWRRVFRGYGRRRRDRYGMSIDLRICRACPSFTHPGLCLGAVVALLSNDALCSVVSSRVFIETQYI